MTISVHPKDVNTLIMTVRTLSANPDMQLSILAYALAISCRSCEVPESAALDRIKRVFEDARGMRLVAIADDPKLVN